MGNKVFIIGISSFAGASFTDYLLKNTNFKIFGTFNNADNITIKLFLKNNKKFSKVNLIKLNLYNSNDLLLKIAKKINPYYIIDFASICMVNESWINPIKYFRINFLSRVNFVKNLNKLKNLKKYIYISTPEIFGSSKKKIKEDSNFYAPSTPYASSKLSTEILLDNYSKNENCKIIIARFTNFYGLGQPLHRLIPKLIFCLNNNLKFPLHGRGLSKRDFIFDRDFNNGIFKIIKRGKIGAKYHFSSNKYLSINTVIKKILAIKGHQWNNVITKVIDRKGKDKYYYLDCKKTMSELKWKSNVSIDIGLKETIKFYDNLNKKLDKKDINFKL